MAHRHGDAGYAIGLQASAVGLTTAAMLWTGHVKAVEAVRQAREDRQQAIWDAYVEGRLRAAAIDARRADELEASVCDLKEQLLSAWVEIARLRKQLAAAEQAP